MPDVPEGEAAKRPRSEPKQGRRPGSEPQANEGRPLQDASGGGLPQSKAAKRPRSEPARPSEPGAQRAEGERRQAPARQGREAGAQRAEGERRQAPATSESEGGLPLLLGPDAEFEGLICFRGSARIEGRVRGEIQADGTVVIGRRARVLARIETDELIVAGQFEGSVRARERIELRPTARVMADLHAPRLALADGCFLEGRCEGGIAPDCAESARESAAAST